MSARRRRLSNMIDQAMTELDIPAHLRERAVAEYESVGAFLDDHFESAGRSGCEVYAQGSFRLGTVIQPLGGGDYDVDLVCCRNLAETSTTKAGLKKEVGGGLAAFLRERPASDGPTLDEGNRCWTLDYRGQQFHMDILPSIPDPEGADNAILLTDRDYREWLHSNPIDYATWFRQRMATEFAQLRMEAAQRVNARVEEIPESEISTTLQRAVQFMKRHRDVYFDRRGRTDLKPPSILITTLGARAYDGGGELFDVLRAIADRMGSFVTDRNGVKWVSNPVEEDENFADKWQEDGRLEPEFRAWLAQLRQDLRELDEAPDDPSGAATLNRLATVIGTDVVSKAIGPSMRGLRLGEFAAATPDPGESFIEDRFPIDLTDDVRLVCRVGRKSGFRDGLLSALGYRVQVGRSLTFNVAGCSVLEPYDVYWKIKNTGDEAARASALRGEIVPDAGLRSRQESTLYRGEHFVECYIVKDGVVRARTRHRVVII